MKESINLKIHEDTSIKIVQTKKEKKKKSIQCWETLSNGLKYIKNEVHKEKGERLGQKKYLEITVKNFPEIIKDIKTHIQEA